MPIKTLSLYLLCVAALAITSCGSQGPEVGKWRRLDDDGGLEFRKDGNFRVLDNMGATVTGTYRIHANGDIRLDATHADVMSSSMQPIVPPQTLNARILIDGDELKLIYVLPDGDEIERYQRIN